MKPTLQDIAHKAGVSVSTVSRVLAGNPDKPASPATAKRILDIARRLGYPLDGRPFHPVAGGRAILFLLASDVYSYHDYFYTQLLAGANDAAVARGFHISQRHASSAAGCQDLRDILREAPHDGVILLGRMGHEFLDTVRAAASNLVYAGLNRIGGGFDEVICDAYDAISDTVDYLHNTGHRRIGYVGALVEDRDVIVNEHRFLAYRDALRRHGLPLERKYCKNIELKTNLAHDAAEELIAEGNLPEALVCATDQVAIGVISALHQAGLRIPGDVSVTGLDGIDIAEYVQPRLTTTYMQQGVLGRLAVKLLLDRLDGGHDLPVLVKLPHRFIERESCQRRVIKRKGKRKV